MRILGRVTSINVRKVLWTADELGVSYEREVWGLPDRDPNAPEFLRLNPNAQVPVLVDGDFVLWESHAIMHYLIGKAGGPLMPAEARLQARVHQWMDWQGSDLAPKATYAVMALVRKVAGWSDEQQITKSLAAWTGRMRILDEALSDGRHFMVGNQFSLADIVLVLQAHRWFAVDREVPDFPAVRAYYERHRNRPAGAPYLTDKTP